MESADQYPYLSPRWAERLQEIRYIAQNSGVLHNLVTVLAKNRFAIFPWVGTRQILTLLYALQQKKIFARLPWMTCPYLEVQFDGSEQQLEAIIYEILNSELDMYSLPLPGDAQVTGKYNEFVPPDLLRKQFVEDYLDFEGLKHWIKMQ